MGKMLRRRHLGWRPTLIEGHTLRSAPLAWLQVEPTLFELAGLDRDGMIHWCSLKVNEADLIRASYNEPKGDVKYAATTVVRAGLVAGVALRAGRLAPLRLEATDPPEFDPARVRRPPRLLPRPRLRRAGRRLPRRDPALPAQAPLIGERA